MSRPEKKIPLIEMFGPTIQGEGSICGHQTMFLRFGTCDYSCKMCDSKHAVDAAEVKKNATYLTPEEIAFRMIEENKDDKCAWVTLSGGNTALWNLCTVVMHLQQNDMTVASERKEMLCACWEKEW